MISIAKGSYKIGTDAKEGFEFDQEGPQISVELPAFYIDATTVTNQEFQEFVQDTNYVTDAEKFGSSFVFHYFLDEETKQISKKINQLSWWFEVAGANWKHPAGPNSSIREKMDHPVVQVSRNDAIAFSNWAGKRLPTEAEWEVAAKGGTDRERYPWGEDFLQNGTYHCNIWQGDFPLENEGLDGYMDTAPVQTYEPNLYGCYQMIGNVWEWCLNPARISLNEFNRYSADHFWKNFQGKDDQMYAIRGGSFLCHQSYCKRYRIAARNGNSGMSASNNLGFRCAKNV
ncbi:formylglycine-generating enzyme family protein [Listeria aquatica]|uniref:Formylglycine-generating enzyme family protein n=1 Tax=Listeria aquatica TaxID=1494960 RepID=A0A841ZMV7_9LIST|nr:formylglycine-generating enzyme family protein [Listeria aquatica]MBC1520604.1 formylglycine-generating enzyme family protein [Listeria aquatica]